MGRKRFCWIVSDGLKGAAIYDKASLTALGFSGIHSLQKRHGQRHLSEIDIWTIGCASYVSPKIESPSKNMGNVVSAIPLVQGKVGREFYEEGASEDKKRFKASRTNTPSF